MSDTTSLTQIPATDQPSHLRCGAAVSRRMFFAILVMLFIAFVYNVGRGPTRRALPWSASDVHEHRIDMFVDHAYYLEATLPEHDFHRYVKRLGLKPWASSDGEWGFSWSFSNQPSWWNPSDSDAESYCRIDGDHFVVAKFENGHVYVQSLSK